MMSLSARELRREQWLRPVAGMPPEAESGRPFRTALGLIRAAFGWLGWARP
jgi:hypothetical protein